MCTASARYSRLNTGLGWTLVFIICLAPLQVGSNRPIFWMMWTALIGLLGALYFIAGLRIDANRGFRWSEHKIIWGLALGVPVMALVQILPLFELPVLAQELDLTASRSVSILSVHFMGRSASLAISHSLCCALRLLSRPKRAEALVWAVFISVMGYTLYALSALLVLGDAPFWGIKAQYESAATGTFINRNSLATYLGMGACLGLGLTLNRSKRIRASDSHHRTVIPDMIQLLLFICLALIGLALLYTQSRLGPSEPPRVGSLLSGLSVETTKFTAPSSLCSLYTRRAEWGVDAVCL